MTMGPRRRGIQLPFGKRRIDRALDDEFRFHMEERVEQFIASGMSRDDAEAEVRRRFGDAEAYHQLARQIDEETMRQLHRFEFFAALRRETARSARILLRTPAFSFIAFLTLAIGIGATTAIFTVLDAVVLRPLPYQDADRLVSVLHPTTVPGSGERKWGVSPGGYFYFRDNARTFEDFGIYRTFSTTVVGEQDAEVAQVGLVTSTMFTVLRARPALGRLIEAADDLPDSTRRVVLGYEYWQRRFGGDRSVLGTILRTSDGEFEIIGVTQPALPLPQPGPFSSATSLAGLGMDLWLPMKLNPAGPFWNNHPNVGVARLRPGVTTTEAQTEIATLTARLPDAVPNAYSPGFMEQYHFRGEVLPLKDSVLGPTLPRTLWTLFGSVILVLLIAAANVANLFLVRLEARRHEAAIRKALGADRRHMAVHYLAESLLLCGAAAVAGLWLSFAGIRALLALAPAGIPRLDSVGLDWPSVAFAFVTALIVGLAFGLMPVVRRDRAAASELREDGRGLSTSRSRRTVRNTLVVGQLALAVVLLASAGLMLRSFQRLRGVEPGFRSDNVLAFNVSLPFTEYATREAAIAFHRQLLDQLRAVAGVASVGAVSTLPLEGYATGCTVVWRENRPFPPGEETPCVPTPVSMPGFFETMGIPVSGRAPDWSDIDGLTQAVVVTQALADRLWPGENPIGQGINSNGSDSNVWYRIVGVVPEIRAEAYDAPATEAVFYAPTSFYPNRRSGAINDLVYVIRTEGVPPQSVIPVARTLLHAMNPRIPFEGPRTMEQVVARSMSRTSFAMVMLGIAAAVALLLSAIGTYGVISYLVTQRRPEIGVRLALGAPVGRVSVLVIVQSLQLAVIGVVLGLLAAWGTTRLLARLLFNVSPTDPVVLGAVSVTLLAIAAVAAFAPALRASRIDPVEVLRNA